MVRREPTTIAWAALTVVLALALPVGVIVGLERRVPVRGIALAAAILFVALLIVSTFALITHHRTPDRERRSLDNDASGAQPPSRQRS